MKQEIFHGGCLSCKSQEIHGVDRCVRCQYFDANWELPNLKIDPEEEKRETSKEKIRNRNGVKKPIHKKGIVITNCKIDNNNISTTLKNLLSKLFSFIKKSSLLVSIFLQG